MSQENISGDKDNQNILEELRDAGLDEEQIASLAEARHRYLQGLTTDYREKPYLEFIRWLHKKTGGPLRSDKKEVIDEEIDSMPMPSFASTKAQHAFQLAYSVPEARKRLAPVYALMKQLEQESPYTNFWNFITQEGEKRMLLIPHKDLALLIDAGITDHQISSLAKVRKHFSHPAFDEQGQNLLRLHFARWLIKTGALNDIGQSDRVIQHLQALDEITLKAEQKVKQQEEEARLRKTERDIVKATPYWGFLRWLREHNRMTPPREIVMAVDELDDPKVRERLKAERERLRAEHCTYHAS